MAHQLNEKLRTYVYYCGEGDFAEVGYENVTELRVSESGHHYLKYGDGMLAIVAPGWLTITIHDESGEWTV